MYEHYEERERDRRLVPFPGGALGQLEHVFETLNVKPDAVADSFIKEHRKGMNDALRKLTGLHSVKNVNILATSEVPVWVHRILDEELSDPKLLWVMAHFSLLSQTTSVLRSASRTLVSDAERRRGQDVLEQAARFLSEDLEEAKRRAVRVVERLKNEGDGHPLGRYLPSFKRIEIHWIIVWLVAQTSRVRYEDALYVVLSHELAHAFTHIGQNTNSEPCSTELFHAMSPHIKEGLAEHYCETLCATESARVKGYGGGPLQAYEALLEGAPDQYHAHRHWPSYDRRRKKGDNELVRRAMLDSRKRGVTDHERFIALMHTKTGN